MNADDPRHGQYAGFMAHLADGEKVCQSCKLARLRYNKALRLDNLRGISRTLPILGSRRRLQALAALGHSQSAIAERLGVTKQRVYQWTADERHRRIYLHTAAQIAEIYEDLSMTVPDGPGSDRVRALAVKKGYIVPLGWDDIDNDPGPQILRKKAADFVDEVLVQRVLSGNVGEAATRANKAERVEICGRWVASGRSVNELARLTGWKPERYTRQEVA